MFAIHLILYRATKEAVHIVRVLHGARDIERTLDAETCKPFRDLTEPLPPGPSPPLPRGDRGGSNPKPQTPIPNLEIHLFGVLYCSGEQQYNGPWFFSIVVIEHGDHLGEGLGRDS